MQFQYFVAFDLSSSSLQCHSVSFCSCVSTYLFEFYSDFVCAICSIHLSPLVRGRMNQNVRHRKQNKSNQHNFVGSMRVSFFSSGSFVFSSGLLFSLSVAAVACRGLPRASFFSSGSFVFSPGSLFSLFGLCRGLPRLAAGFIFLFGVFRFLFGVSFFALRSLPWLATACRGFIFLFGASCFLFNYFFLFFFFRFSVAAEGAKGPMELSLCCATGPLELSWLRATGPMELSWCCATGPMELICGWRHGAHGAQLALSHGANGAQCLRNPARPRTEKIPKALGFWCLPESLRDTISLFN